MCDLSVERAAVGQPIGTADKAAVLDLALPEGSA